MTHPTHTTNGHAKATPCELTRAAEAWAAYALARTGLEPSYFWPKAKVFVRFCVERGAKGFAVPSKLYGTRGRQDAVRLEARLGGPVRHAARG